MGIVVLVVLAVAGVSMAQIDATFRDSESRRMLSSAETLAKSGVVRQELATGAVPEAMSTQAEITRTYAGADYVITLDREGDVRSATLPLTVERIEVGGGTPFDGSAWTGTTQRYGSRSLEAHVPVLSDGPDDIGTRLGYVIVGVEYPSWWELLRTVTPGVLLYLALAATVGVVGSLLLARRVKRQTLGLEPREITALVEQREAMLHGVREGVLGVDRDGRITFANDEAVRLLSLPDSPVGRPVDDIGQPPTLTRLLRGTTSTVDHVEAVSSRLLVINSMPVRIRGSQTGSVTTMRDRTELLDLQQQLALAQDSSDTLRAQIHEFRNRLHVISGLVELGKDEEILDFIGGVSREMSDRVEGVTHRIKDPAVAALLIAKDSRATELAIDFELTADSWLRAQSPGLSTDLVTVVGNLVDNAYDALGSGGRVTVDVTDDGSTITVTVTDSGPGIAPDAVQLAFEQGWTSKEGGGSQDHGWGLALTRLACQRNGGEVRVDPEQPSRIVATLQADPATVDIEEGV